LVRDGFGHVAPFAVSRVRPSAAWCWIAIGSILLAWWLVAVAAGGEVFAATHAFIASPIGVTLFGWSVAFSITCGLPAVVLIVTYANC
jgi:hypothetical protein